MSVVAGAPLSVREPGVADAGCTLSDMRCVSSIRRRVHLSQPYHSASSSSSVLFTSKETVQTIRDEEPRRATSTFTQLLSSIAVSLAGYTYVLATEDDLPREGLCLPVRECLAPCGHALQSCLCACHRASAYRRAGCDLSSHMFMCLSLSQVFTLVLVCGHSRPDITVMVDWA